MDDKNYVDSMLGINAAFMNIDSAISATETVEMSKKRYSFCSAAAKTGIIDTALFGVLKATYYLLSANGMVPEKYSAELLKTIPGETHQQMEIGNKKETYTTNRAVRIYGVMSFLTKYKLLSAAAINKVTDPVIKDAIRTIATSKKTVKALSTFEKEYTKLRFDKADSPLLLIKHYFDIMKENKEALARGETINLGDGRTITGKKAGNVVYGIITGPKNTVIVGPDGEPENVKKGEDPEKVIKRKAEAVKKPKDKVKEPKKEKAPEKEKEPEKKAEPEKEKEELKEEVVEKIEEPEEKEEENKEEDKEEKFEVPEENEEKKEKKSR